MMENCVSMQVFARSKDPTRIIPHTKNQLRAECACRVHANLIMCLSIKVSYIVDHRMLNLVAAAEKYNRDEAPA